MDQSTFLIGFISGFGVAGVLGFVYSRIVLARNAMARLDAPMPQLGPGTPRTVMNAADRGRRDCAIFAFFFMLVLIGTLYSLYLVLRY